MLPQCSEFHVEQSQVLQSLLGFCSALTPKAQSAAWTTLLQKAEPARGVHVHPTGNNIKVLLTVTKQSFRSGQGTITLVVRQGY